jgi:hypothetical protein
MLQKIVFQDNIYHLTRSIDIVHEGLMLKLSSDYFLDKTVDDLLFFDASIQKLFRQLQGNLQMSGYIATLHNLYSCQNRYIELLDFILQGKSRMHEEFNPLLTKLQSIRNIHIHIKDEMTGNIQKSDTTTDSRDIVSSNELSELLNF